MYVHVSKLIINSSQCVYNIDMLTSTPTSHSLISRACQNSCCLLDTHKQLRGARGLKKLRGQLASEE